MNVLIGGGTGFVGRHLVKTLKNRGARVQVISRKGNKSKDQISWVSLDSILSKSIGCLENII